MLVWVHGAGEPQHLWKERDGSAGFGRVLNTKDLLGKIPAALA